MIKRGYGAIILIAVFIFTAVFSVPVYANSNGQSRGAGNAS